MGCDDRLPLYQNIDTVYHQGGMTHTWQRRKTNTSLLVAAAACPSSRRRCVQSPRASLCPFSGALYRHTPSLPHSILHPANTAFVQSCGRMVHDTPMAAVCFSLSFCSHRATEASVWPGACLNVHCVENRKEPFYESIARTCSAIRRNHWDCRARQPLHQLLLQW